MTIKWHSKKLNEMVHIHVGSICNCLFQETRLYQIKIINTWRSFHLSQPISVESKSAVGLPIYMISYWRIKVTTCLETPLLMALSHPLSLTTNSDSNTTPTPGHFFSRWNRFISRSELGHTHPGPSVMTRLNQC